MNGGINSTGPDTVPTVGELGLQPALAAGPKGQKVSLTPHEVTLVSALSRHYRKQFGQRMDVEEFVANHLYARIVLQQSRDSGNAELAGLAAHFLDERGMPRLHRGRSDLDLEF